MTLFSFGHSQWWGDGGSSLGWATVELAKLLNAAEEGLMHSGTRFEFSWSWMNLCNRSFTLDTLVSSDSQESSKITSATGSKSLVYCLIPPGAETQQEHIHEWYLSRPSSRYGWFRVSATLILFSGSRVNIWQSRCMASWVADAPSVYRAVTEGGLHPLESICRLAASHAYFMSDSVGVPRRSVIKSSCCIGDEAWNKILLPNSSPKIQPTDQMSIELV